MAKLIPDAVLDAALDVVATAIDLDVCATAPANFAGIGAVSLANVALDAGDFTIANGDVSGRKITISAQNAVPVTVAGDADHVVLSSGTAITLQTTATTQALTDGNTVNVPAFKYEIQDGA